MNDEERRMLAADIAKRVRMYAWQPLPPDIGELLGEYGWTQSVQMFGRSQYNARLRLDYVAQPQRLTLSFEMPNGELRGTFLWTPE